MLHCLAFTESLSVHFVVFSVLPPCVCVCTMFLETVPRLKHQDHRLAVRPRMQRPPSSAHLQNLKEREDVFSEIRPSRSVTFDNATWSTYLAKKDMDPKAEAGLALKIDFSAVKLRKTVSNPGEERERSEAVGGPNSVVEYCDPTKLLLHIKGEYYSLSLPPHFSSLSPGAFFPTFHYNLPQPCLSPPFVSTCLSPSLILCT